MCPAFSFYLSDLLEKLNSCTVQAGQYIRLQQRLDVTHPLDTKERETGILRQQAQESTPMLGRGHGLG